VLGNFIHNTYGTQNNNSLQIVLLLRKVFLSCSAATLAASQEQHTARDQHYINLADHRSTSQHKMASTAGAGAARPPTAAFEMNKCVGVLYQPPCTYQQCRSCCSERYITAACLSMGSCAAQQTQQSTARVDRSRRSAAGLCPPLKHHHLCCLTSCALHTPNTTMQAPERDQGARPSAGFEPEGDDRPQVPGCCKGAVSGAVLCLSVAVWGGGRGWDGKRYCAFGDWKVAWGWRLRG